MMLTANPGSGSNLVGTTLLLGAAAPLYRKVFYLRIAVPASRLAFHANETTFNFRFEPLSYDVLKATGLDVALKAKTFPVTNQMMGISLHAPRRLDEVRGQQAAFVNSVNVHRLDMDTPSDKPTTSFALHPLIASQIVFVLEGQLARAGNSLVLRTETVAAAPPPQSFVDQRFAFAAPDNSAASDHVKEVWVTSFPTLPRLSLAGTDLKNPFGFWRESGQHTSILNRSVGAAFAETLQRYVDRLEQIPNPLDIAIIAESDAECAFEITNFALLPRGVVSVFAGDAPKVTLNFEKKTTATAAFTVPAGVTVQSAAVSTDESLRGDRSGALDVLSTAFQGVRVTEKFLAQAVKVDTALTVSGVRLGVSGLQAPIVLNVELQPDHQNLPSGKVLARTAVTIARAGDVAWVTAHFDEPVILPFGTHWVVVQAAEGRAVWLTEPADDAVATVERSTPNSAWTRVRGVQATRAKVALVWVGGSLPAAPPVTVSVGTHTVVERTVDAESGTVTYPFTTPLIAHLSEGGSPALTVTSQTRGLVTLKNLRVEFTA